jgi:putative transposase
VIVQAVTDLAATTGVVSACALLGMPRSSYYRRSRPIAEPPSQPEGQDHGAAVEPPRRLSSKRALSVAERAQIHALLNSERFADLSPREVYATLLDEGVYHCSWSTMYRLLRERGETKRRRDQPQPTAYAKPELLATRPRQLWSWDITKLKGPSPWTYFYLYVILDVFSRYVVGWMIALCERAELAEAFIAETCEREQIAPQQLTLHADRGSAMTSKCVAQLLVDLGVAKTHSRPHVSDDNPFSEAQFKTTKYHPTFPERFGSLEDARAWARPFFVWYNQEHHHSALGLLTPSQVHQGQADAVLAARQQVMVTAYEAHPERFVRGVPQPMRAPAAVWINPPTQQPNSPPDTIFPLLERSSPDQLDLATPSRGFTAQRPLDGVARSNYAVAERPADGKKQLDAP